MTDHACVFLIVNSSCFRQSSALFKLDRDERLKRLRNATTIAHAWDEDSKYYDVANLTGIPPHIVNYVNHEKLSEKIDSKFQQYEKLVTDELDKRQMGGGLTFELIEGRISKPILEELSALKNAIINRTDGPAPARNIVGMPKFQWESDTKQIPRLLPENYVLPTKIHPLAMWQQWHHGASFKDGIAVGPLKEIESSNCPKKFQRSFCLMRKFCKALDSTSGVSGSESVAELGVAFKDNGAKLRGLGVLLPETTPTNRSRTRNENGWCYIACQWEKLVALQKKAIDSGVSVDDLLRASNEKERQRQKRKRDKDKAKKTAASQQGVGEDDGVTTRQAAAQRPRRNAAGEFPVSGSVASTMNNLLR